MGSCGVVRYGETVRSAGKGENYVAVREPVGYDREYRRRTLDCRYVKGE